MVVGVVMGVSSNLLSLGRNTSIIVTQRVAVRMAVKVDFGLLVTDGDGIIVVDTDGLKAHDIVAQSLLELWGHEVVTRAGSCEDGEVDLEPEKVEEERNDDQANSASSKVLAKLGQSQGTLSSVDVHQVPEVNHDWYTNGEEREDTDVLDGDNAAQTDTSQKEPLPPFPPESIMTLLVEANVG